MTKLLTISVLALIAVSSPALIPGAVTMTPQHRFIIEEYEKFHEVLHHLEHKALPKRDFPTIRTKASQLVSRGKAIVKLGVPLGPDRNRKEFAKQRKKFDKALARFSSDARASNDDSLKVSFSAVHDSFEMLAELLPSLYPRGMPPTISVDCPTRPEAGSKITFTAHTPEPAELMFTWTVSAGKIVTGQGTRSITVDTSGLAGETISVAAEVNDGSGLAAIATCEVHVAPQTAEADPAQVP